MSEDDTSNQEVKKEAVANEQSESGTQAADQAVEKRSSSICPNCRYRFRFGEIRKIIRPWRCSPVLNCPNCRQPLTADEIQATRLERGCRWVRRGIGLGILYLLMELVFEFGGSLAPALGLVGAFLFVTGILLQRVDGIRLIKYVEEEEEDDF